jgi:hypothetical protein
MMEVMRKRGRRRFCGWLMSSQEAPYPSGGKSRGRSRGSDLPHKREQQAKGQPKQVSTHLHGSAAFLPLWAWGHRVTGGLHWHAAAFHKHLI